MTKKFSRKNEYILNNNTAEIIVLSKDKVEKTIINIDDLERVLSFGKWYIDNTGYVKNSHKSERLHRFIINCPKEKQVDHINGNILDNRKENLRIVNIFQNRQNQNVNYIRNKSGQTGVQYCIYHKNTKWEKHYWKVKIKLNKKEIYNKCYELNDLDTAINHAKYIRAYHMPYSKEAREISISKIPNWVKELE